MKKKKIAIILTVMLMLNLIVIIIGTQHWKEATKNIVQGYGYGEDIESRFTSSPLNKEDLEDAEEEDSDAQDINSIAEQAGITSTSQIMYTTHSLNVREDATTESEIIGRYEVGESVIVTGKVNNGWVQVDYDELTGYVLGDYLSLEGSADNEESQQPQETLAIRTN